MSVSLSAQATSAGAARRAIWQLLVAEVLIGSVGVFVHESGQDPVTAVFYRCLFGALFLTVCGLIGGQLRGLWRERALLRDAVISGVLLVLNWVALFAGMARSSISVATMVYHVFPFVMLILAALLHCCRASARGVSIWAGRCWHSSVWPVRPIRRGSGRRPIAVI